MASVPVLSAAAHARHARMHATWSAWQTTQLLQLHALQLHALLQLHVLLMLLLLHALLQLALLQLALLQLALLPAVLLPVLTTVRSTCLECSGQPQSFTLQRAAAQMLRLEGCGAARAWDLPKNSAVQLLYVSVVQKRSVVVRHAKDGSAIGVLFPNKSNNLCKSN